MILASEELAKYVLWYRGLSGEEAHQWDRFLAGLTPADHLKAAVEAFRFAGDAPGDPEDPEQVPASRADPARELILDGLAAIGHAEGS